MMHYYALRQTRVFFFELRQLLLGMPHPTSENLPSKIYISPPISLRFHPPSRPPVRAPSAHTNSGDMPLGLPVVCVTLPPPGQRAPPVVCVAPPPPRRAHPNSLGRGHTSEPSRAVLC
eukprot:jgi/Chrzof1/8785/Cz03g24140.t1